MKVEQSEVTKIKITELEHLDPITVYIEEWQEKKYNDIRYQGRITILCYGMALNYFWGAMGRPMKEFFCTASTSYIADKFELNARETFKPQAYTGYFDDEDNWQTKDADDVDVEMSEHHRKYICKIIEAVKDAFRELLKQEGTNGSGKI